MTFADLPQPFTRAEAVSHGVSPRRLELALGRHDLTRVAAGLYATPAAWAPLRPWQQHRLLGETARRVVPDAILSHTSAAALLDLPLGPRPPLRASMTLLHDSRTSERTSWLDLHRGATPPDQVVIRQGRAELVPARTVVDTVRVLSPRDGLAVLDGAARRGLVTRRAIIDVRRRQRRWPGIARFDEVIRLVDGRRESWLESVSAWVMHSWAVPDPDPQVIVLDRRGHFVARVDALWAGHGVVGEADGEAKYLLGPGGDREDERMARAVIAQVRREDRLRDLGLGVVRWGTRDLDEPLALRCRVLDALDRTDPARITAQYRCSCCHLPLTDCGKPTRFAA